MLAVTQRRDGVLGVNHVRAGNGDRVNLRVRAKRLEVVGRLGNAEFSGQFPCCFDAASPHSGHLGARVGLDSGDVADFRKRTRAYHANAEVPIRGKRTHDGRVLSSPRNQERTKSP
jgi:hypothetical protein